MWKLLLSMAVVMLAGCASSVRTSVIEAEEGVYAVLQQGDQFWESEQKLKERAMSHAEQFCSERDGLVQLAYVRLRGIAPRPGIQPETEIYFQCAGPSNTSVQ